MAGLKSRKGFAPLLLVVVAAVVLPVVVLAIRNQQSLQSDASTRRPGMCRWFFCRSPRPLPSPIASVLPSPVPSGCYYKPVLCPMRFPDDGTQPPECRPVLVCPSVLPSGTPLPTVSGVPLPSDFCRLTGRPEPCPSVPTQSCLPRPKCLDSIPRCLIAEPAEGWCPVPPVQ